MRIGELARQADTRQSTIRYYERRRLLVAPARGRSGQRRYDSAALNRLGFIRLAQAAGLTLSEIRHLLDDFPSATPPSLRWHSIRSAKLKALDERIRRLQAAKRHLRATTGCRCRDLDECGRKAALRGGD